ncbi:MAG TPA: DUF2341 domain-containing protein, partial [Methanosarcina sp.]|nr:DUF2341 domain-containing protein [Methanosarcina sp.]
LTDCALAATNDPLAISTKGDLWNYSQIVITENAGKILTDYPVPVNLNSSNFNFSKAKSDGSDIRFSSQNRTLNYWIEKWDPEKKEAVVWVKIPNLPANGTSTILMKYGNSGATPASSGENTFDFFDSFDGNNLNNLNWNAESAGGGTVEVKNGICQVAAPKVHAYDSSTIYSKDNFDINSMFVVKRMKVTTGTDTRGPLLRQGFVDQIKSKKNEIKHETQFANESRLLWQTAYNREKSSPLYFTDAGVPEGQWYVSTIAWYEENETRKVAWFKDGIRNSRTDYTSNDYITNLPMHVYLYAASYSDASKNTGYMAVDYIFVRKFFGADPTVKVVSTLEPEIQAENTSGKMPKIWAAPESELVSKAQATPEPTLNSKTSSEEIAKTQKNISGMGKEANNTTFPEYNVNTSGIKLSSPYDSDFPTLVEELNSLNINTIFLSVNNTDVWQYERFVKMAHEKGKSVHAVLLEDVNIGNREAMDTSSESLNSVLDYNVKSLAPFDGIEIYVNSSVRDNSKTSIDYRTLFETAHRRIGENVSLSANLPYNYTTSLTREIAPFTDFFVIRAYPGGIVELNSMPIIVDTIAPQMGEIRGAGSKGIIEISVNEGFKNESSIQELFADLADYYSKDSAFMGVSISDYGAYSNRYMKAEVEEKKSLIPEIPGFEGFFVFAAVFGGFAFL